MKEFFIRQRLVPIFPTSCPAAGPEGAGAPRALRPERALPE